MSDQPDIFGSSFQAQLERAKKGIPKVSDSEGREYYIGLTPGQLLSCWWGDNSGICNKIGSDIKKGATNEEILEKYGKEYKDLLVDHLEWLRNRFWIDASRDESDE